MIQVTLTQIGMNKPGDETGRNCFNETTFTAPSVEEALAKLKHEYGITPPKKKRGVYIGDTQIGFVNARWQEYCGRDRTGSYWEENWVSFMEMIPCELPKHIKI